MADKLLRFIIGVLAKKKWRSQEPDRQRGSINAFPIMMTTYTLINYLLIFHATIVYVLYLEGGGLTKHRTKILLSFNLPHAEIENIEL